MKNENGPSREKRSYWTLKITIITFLIAVFFSFISDITTNYSNLIVAVILLILLIIISIIFDGIAVAVTTCEKAPLAAMAARKIKGSKIALKLKSKANIVANICADVIGDICGIVSGSATIVIVMKILLNNPTLDQTIITILFSSTVAAMTVGGKALMKGIAMNKSKEIIMTVARIISIFVKEKKI